jgi:hypothetical protein
VRPRVLNSISVADRPEGATSWTVRSP